MNRVAQKPTPRVPRNKKSEAGSRHAKKDNEAVISVVMNMRKTERNVLHGGKHVTSVKVEITLSPNAREYMPYHTPKMVMIMMMTSGSWP